MPEGKKPRNDREFYAVGTEHNVLGRGVLTVRSADFDDEGRCKWWIDNNGLKHFPLFDFGK